MSIILAAADIHSNIETYRWLPETIHSQEPDLTVLAGDLLGAPQSYETAESDQLRQAEEILELLPPVDLTLSDFYRTIVREPVSTARKLPS